MAVFAVLAVSPAMADDQHVYTDDAWKLTGEHAVQDSDFITDETYYKKEEIGGFLFWKDYKYYHHGDSLIMEGTVTNRIESGVLSSTSFTVSADDDVKMLTEKGVNIITGNAYEIKDELMSIVGDAGYPDSIVKYFVMTSAGAPTVNAQDEVIMDGPANTVMFGSSVTGKNITLTNTGSSITSADKVMEAFMKGLKTNNLPAQLIPDSFVDSYVMPKLAPLQAIQGNFNIVQGSTIGNKDTQSVTMHASLVDKTIPTGTDAIAANVVLGGSSITAQNINLTGMASVVTNTPLKEAFDELLNYANSDNASELQMMKKLLEAGKATSLTATNGNINLGSDFNLLHGGNFSTDPEVDTALSLTANNGAVNMLGMANALSGNVVVNASEINLTGTPLQDGLPAMVDGIVDGLVGKIPAAAGIVDKLVTKGSVNVVTGGATLTSTGNITMSAKSVDDVGKIGNINAVLDTELADLITTVCDGEPSSIMPKADGTIDTVSTTLTSTNGDINLLGRVNVVNGLRGQVVVNALNGDVNLEGNISMVSGYSTVKAENININIDESVKYKMFMDADELGALLPNGTSLPEGVADMLATTGVNAALVAGGANLTADKDITTGGTVGLLMNTPVADAIKEFNPLSSTKNPSELEIVGSLLQKGEATTLTSTNGNINVGSQFNLLHGGNMGDDDAALTLTANKGAVNVQGTANVVSGNVLVQAGDINMTGEVLPNGMATAANGLVSSLTEGIGIPAVSNVLGKLVNKGSVNMVTGGATLDAAGNITMNGKSVDDVGKIGNINAVIDTQMVDVLNAYLTGKTDSLEQGGGYTTKLEADGNIDLLGRVNLVNGSYVELNAGNEVNMQGNLSVIGGSTVKGNSININTVDDKKYKMFIDSSDLGVDLPLDADTAAKLGNTGINAAIVAGGAKLEAKEDITLGGTVGLVVNTPAAGVMDELMSYTKHEQETWLAYQVLQQGIATSVKSTEGNINLGSDFNLIHGGNFSDNPKKPTALVIDAAQAVNVHGTANVVSGNVTVEGNTINLTGERLTGDMAGAAGSLAGSVVGSIAGDVPAVDGMVDKLVSKGSLNVVTGGATLTADNGITMNSVHDKGAINAVLDTELIDPIEAFMERDLSALMEGGSKQTTLTATNGNIELLGSLNLVNGGKVELNAENGTVDLNGSLSMISGGATVNAQNIKINDDETGKYQTYFDAAELGALLPAGSPITELLDTMGITDLLGSTGVNAGIVAGGSELTATGNITTGGTVSFVVNTPLSEMMKEFESYTKHEQETWMAYQLLQKGAATTLTSTDGDIKLASRLNLLHGGNIADASEALQLSAAKGEVKMSGSANLVSGNVIVNAEDITMYGEPLKFDMGDAFDGVPGAEMLNKLAAKGSANVVTGGATLEATNDIELNSLANFVLDTELTDVVEAFMERDLDSLGQGGSYKTTLDAENDLHLKGRLNVVNGGQVALTAGETVKIEGTANIISGNSKVNGKNIEIIGNQNVSLDLGSIDLPAEYDSYGELVDEMGIFDKLTGGVNGNVIAGGADLTAKESLKVTGMANFIVDTGLGNVVDVLTTGTLDSLAAGGSNPTTLTTENGDITIAGRLNIVNGGQVYITAGQANNWHDVNLNGTFNLVSGNAHIKGDNININNEGQRNFGLNWDAVMPEGVVGNLAEGMGITDKLDKGVSANVVMGGAKLDALTDIALGGSMASVVANTSLGSAFEALTELVANPNASELELMADILNSGMATKLNAGNNIEMDSRLNVLHGGNFTADGKNALVLTADNAVNMDGTFNVVSGNVQVNAKDIELHGSKNVSADLTPVISKYLGTDYAEMAIASGMIDEIKTKGMNANVVTGGATLTATGDIKMDGMVNAVLDTDLVDLLDTVRTGDTSHLTEGGSHKTTLQANGNVDIEGRLNVLNNAAVVAKGGNVSIGGGSATDSISVIKNTSLTSEQGQVTFTNTTVSGSGSSVSAATGMTLSNATVLLDDVTLFGGETTIAADSLLSVTDVFTSYSGSIENMGSLSLNDVALTDTTLNNGGVIEINGDLSLDSAKLSFVVDDLTSNTTAITLGGAADILAGGSVDITFVIEGDKVASALYNNQEFSFVLFTGADSNDYDNLLAALAGNEVSFTLNNSEWTAYTSGIELKHDVGGNIVITGNVMVPEPTTATLSLLALAALAARRRRK